MKPLATVCGMLASLALCDARVLAQTAQTQPWIIVSSSTSRASFQPATSGVGLSGTPSGSNFGVNGDAGVLTSDTDADGVDYSLGEPFNTDDAGNTAFRDHRSVRCFFGDPGGARPRLVDTAGSGGDAQASGILLLAFSQPPQGLVVQETDLRGIDRSCQASWPQSRHDIAAAKTDPDPIGTLIATLDTVTPARTDPDPLGSLIAMLDVRAQ